LDCIFCAIVAGRAPAEVIFEDEETIAFMDVNPANPGHILVIPKRHVRDIYKLDEETAAAVMRTTVRVARAIRAALKPDGMNLLQANGRTAGQSVFHFHVHIVPRWHGDGLRLARPLQVKKSTTIQEIAHKLRRAMAKSRDARPYAPTNPNCGVGAFGRTPLKPEKIRAFSSRIHILKERCKGCGFCIEFCPWDVLERSEEFNSTGYQLPAVKDEGACIGCGLCEMLCPEFAIYVVKETP